MAKAKNWLFIWLQFYKNFPDQAISMIKWLQTLLKKQKELYHQSFTRYLNMKLSNKLNI